MDDFPITVGVRYQNRDCANITAIPLRVSGDRMSWANYYSFEKDGKPYTTENDFSVATFRQNYAPMPVDHLAEAIAVLKLVSEDGTTAKATNEAVLAFLEKVAA